MGGRGSVSVTGGVIIVGRGFEGGNDILSLGGNPDKREDITNMFREIGFSGVEGLSGTDTAVLGAYGIALNRLEREYGALSVIGEIPVLGANTSSTIAAVRYDRLGGKANALILSRNLMGNISRLVASQRSMEESGYKMPTDNSLLSSARYTVTHEYGHLMHNALSQATGKTERQIFNEAKRSQRPNTGRRTLTFPATARRTRTSSSPRHSRTRIPATPTKSGVRCSNILRTMG